MKMLRNKLKRQSTVHSGHFNTFSLRHIFLEEKICMEFFDLFSTIIFIIFADFDIFIYFLTFDETIVERFKIFKDFFFLKDNLTDTNKEEEDDMTHEE